MTSHDLQNVTAYPVSRGRLVNIAAFRCEREKVGMKYEGETVAERTKEELLKEFEGWEDEVTQLLQVCFTCKLAIYNLLTSIFTRSASRDPRHGLSFLRISYQYVPMVMRQFLEMQ